jgi:3-oxoacyl-[acyl-carrier-protein] synthase II
VVDARKERRAVILGDARSLKRSRLAASPSAFDRFDVKDSRTAITGLGAITALGNSATETWTRLCRGESGLRNERAWLEQELPGFKKLRTHLAGRVRDYDLLTDDEFPAFGLRVKRRELDREVSRGGVLALRAAAEALQHGGLLTDDLEVPSVDSLRFAVVLGSGIGGASLIDKVGADLSNDRRPHSTQMYQVQPDNPTLAVKRFFGAKGSSMAVTQACASGGVAIALGAMIIERNEADIVIAGGAEALEGSLVALFEATGAANEGNEATNAVRPFDVDAPGAVLAEAAGALILEREEHARARGASILGYLDGYGITSGGGSATLMDEEGIVRAMQLALARGEVSAPRRVSINPHATGTRAGDRVEANAIRRLANGAADQSAPPVVSVFPVKGGMGHSIGASGGVEAVVSVMALQAGVAPPAATTREALAEVRDLLPLAAEPTPLEAEAVLSNSMGFGDQNVSLLIRRPGS